MQSPSASLTNAWLAAAQDLGIRVVAPIRVATEDGSAAEFPAMVVDFGSRAGTLVCDSHEVGRGSAVASQLGCFVSGLNAEAYATYDRQQFRDTLEDWGWYGGGAPPPWYRGVSPWG